MSRTLDHRIVIDQGKERLSMYLLKRHVLPVMYWDGLVKGYNWPHFGRT